MEELLAHTREITPGAREPVRATYPAGGFSSVPLRIRTR
jgi:hypothetical protein